MADSVPGIRYREFPASEGFSEYVVGYRQFHVAEFGDGPYDDPVPPDG